MTSSTQQQHPPVDRATPLYSIRALSRSYGATRALRACSFDLYGSEIHALIGENGSGKSTLVKVLTGVLSPDSGQIVVPDGSVRTRFSSPRVAASDGVATVFQETLVADHLSVLDNIWLGYDTTFRRVMGLQDQRRSARDTLAKLSEHPPPLNALVGSLDLGRRQLVVIARALVREPRLLILDESTSALDVADQRRLFDVLRGRRDEDHATVFISHRMDEISSLADRVTVLRAGQSVATMTMRQTSTRELLNLMAGRELDVARARSIQQPGEVALIARKLQLRSEAEPFDFTLRSGEVVGVAGLEGHGQEPFIQALCGVVAPLAGRVETAAGSKVHSLRQASRLGIAYVPRDRKAAGIFEPLSILDNFAVPTRRNYSVAGFLQSRKQRKAFDLYTLSLRVKHGSLNDRITTLSGGNQQKVIIARWLAAEPKVIVLNDPTRGVDQATKQDVYALIDVLCKRGAAIVMLCTEIEEPIGLADRTLVFREHSPFVELPHDRTTADSIVAAMFGQSAEFPR